MRPLPPPLRFLAAVVGGWAAIRAAMLAPWWPAEAGTAARPSEPAIASARAAPRRAYAEAANDLAAARPRPLPAPAPPAMPRPAFPPPERDAVASPGIAPVPPVAAAVAPDPVRRPTSVPPPAPGRLAGRWSGSAWAFVRRGDSGAALAAGGTLGGSQIGMRLTYRLGRGASSPLALSARLSSPGRPAAAEAALGIEWQPERRVPLRLLAERRQALGDEGRSAFALLAFGGVYDRPVAGLRFDAYAQAGMVGVRSRDLFADAAARLALPVDEAGRVRIGVGTWAAAQPGVARLDAGPHASVRLPGVTLALDWRVRLAGDAAPGTGPSATLSTDF